MPSPHNHLNGKQFACARLYIPRPVTSYHWHKCIVGKLLIVFHLFNRSGSRFICKIALIISSCWESVTGHFAPGSVPISCHIIVCFVRVTLALNREAVPAAAVIRKMFISKWCFFNRNKRHITITAQLVGASSFISEFSLRFSPSSKSLIKSKRRKGYIASLKRQWLCRRYTL